MIHIMNRKSGKYICQVKNPSLKNTTIVGKMLLAPEPRCVRCEELKKSLGESK